MSIITGNQGSKLCPELAKPTTIITKDNVSALKLSTYNRTQGTTVTVSCLVAPDYQLVGPSVLTCLSTSQWDKATPTCRLVVPTSGGGFDITMVPMLVAAGTMAVLLLALICIMIFVVCCWKHSKSGGFGKSMRGTPMGLFRSLSLQEAESVFSQRRHRYYPASECSDVIDSISARCPSHTFAQTPEVGSRYPFSDTMSRSSPTTYITAVSRGTELPFRTRGLTTHSYSPGQGQSRDLQTDSVSRASPTTYVTGVSRGQEPPLKIRVGTGQPYRTWHELFYNSYT